MVTAENYHQTVTVYPRNGNANRGRGIESGGAGGHSVTASNALGDATAHRGPPPRSAAPFRHSGHPGKTRDSGDDVMSFGSIRPGPPPQLWAGQAVPSRPPASGAAPAVPPSGRRAPTGGGRSSTSPPRDAAGPVQMSLQDMLATAARLHSELMASASGPRAPAESPVSRAPSVDVQPQPYALAAPNPEPQQPPGAAAQPRGPLEALRDELFGGLALSAYGVVLAGPPLPGALAAVAAAVAGSPERTVRSASGSADAAITSPATAASPAPSVMALTEPGTAPLQEETSALTAHAGHSYADLSSIYSIPDSTFNAAARTPMSITTAAVSELDTPSSARSRDEEYDKSFASPTSSPQRCRGAQASGSRPGASGRPEYDRIASGYDDYVSPASWMSLRERHTSSHPAATSTASGPEMGHRGGSATSTPTGPSAGWAVGGGGIDLVASAAAISPPPPASPSAPTASMSNAITDVAGSTTASATAASQPRGQQQEQQRPQGPRPDIVALFPPQQLTQSLDELGPQGGSSPSSGSPHTAFSSIVLPDSRGRERTNSGHLHCSLSFGAASGAASCISSGTGSRLEGDEGVGGAAAAAAAAALPLLPSGQEVTLRPMGVLRMASEAAAHGGAAATGRIDVGDSTARSLHTGVTFINPLFMRDSADGSHGGYTDGVSSGGGDGGSNGGGVRSPCSEPHHGDVGAPPPATACEGVAAAEAQDAAAEAGGEQREVGLKRGRDYNTGPAADGRPGGAPINVPAGADAGSSNATPSVHWDAELQRLLSRASAPSAAPTRSTGDGADASAAPSYARSAAETEGNDHIQPLPIARPPSLSMALAPVSPPPAVLDTWNAAAKAAATPPPQLPPRPQPEPSREDGSRRPPLAPSSGVSAAALGAVPAQDRRELVRSWAQAGADFAARPQNSASNGGAASTVALSPESSRERVGAPEAPREGAALPAAVTGGGPGAGTGMGAVPAAGVLDSEQLATLSRACVVTDPLGAIGAATADDAAAADAARGVLSPPAPTSQAVSVLALTAAADSDVHGHGAPSPAAAAAAVPIDTRHSINNPGPQADSAHAPLAHLLSLLSCRGARGEAVDLSHLGDTLQSAVFEAVSRARPNSAPVLSGVNTSAGDGDAGDISRLPAQTAPCGLPEHPHPHLQPDLPLQPNAQQQHQLQQQQQQIPSAGDSARPQAGLGPAPAQVSAASALLRPISPTGSLGSVDSDVAAERLKAKMRAYLLAAEAAGAGAASLSAAWPASAQAAAMSQLSPPAAEVPFLSPASLDALLQQATLHLQPAGDPAAAAATGGAQPSLSSLEEILRQLRQLTRSSSGGGAPQLRPHAAGDAPAAADAAGQWARPGRFGSGGGAGSSIGTCSASLSGGGAGGPGGGASTSNGGFSGTSGGSAGHGGESIGAGRMSSSVGSVSLWATSTATGSAVLPPSRASRAASSPSRLGAADAAVAAAAAAKTAAAAAAAANVLGLRADGPPHAPAPWAAAPGHSQLPPAGQATYPPAASRSPRAHFHPPPHPGGHSGGLAPAAVARGAVPTDRHRRTGSQTEWPASRGSQGASSAAAGAVAADEHEYHHPYPTAGVADGGHGGRRGSGGGAGLGGGEPLLAGGTSFQELAAHADKLREQLGVGRAQVSPCLRPAQGSGGGEGAEAELRQAAPWAVLQSPGSSPRAGGYGGAASLLQPHWLHSGTAAPQHGSHPTNNSPRGASEPPQQQQQQHRQQPGNHRPASYGGEAAAAGRVAATVDWHAALQSKLLPYDAVRDRDSWVDASVALAAGLPAGAYAAEALGAPPLPQPTAWAGQYAGAANGSGGGGGGFVIGPQERRNVSAARQSRPQSPATNRPGTRPNSTKAGGSTAAAARSAPATPRRGNSPARKHHGAAAAAPPVHSAAAANLVAPSKSPRAGSANLREGRAGSGSSGSILDRAAPRGGSGGGGGGSPTRRGPFSPMTSSEPIAIVRPFAWQERETRHWLEELGLLVGPADESLPLLDNPLRNGLLLAALAARVVGSPLPAGVVTDPPRDVRSARTNILCALDHLGMLAAPWAPPPDAERRARAQAAAAEMAAAVGAAAGGTGSNGGASNGRSRSPSPARSHASGPTAGSSGIIAIKALGSAGRGYALRLKERQLRAGLGLTAEVESVLAGYADSIWGLFNFIRLAVAPQYQYLRGSGLAAQAAGQATTGRRPWAPGGVPEGPRRSFDVRGGAGPDGKEGPGPAPAAVAAAAAAAPPAASGPSTGQSGRASPSRMAAGKDSGGAADNDAGNPLTGSQEQSPTLRGGGKVALAGGRGRMLVSGGPVADPRGSILVSAAAGGHTGPGPGASSSGGGASAANVAMTESGLLFRPLWPQLASLPYSPPEVAALELSLLLWLAESGAISRREAAQGFPALLPMFEDGTFICWLVSNLSGKPIVGAHRRPLTEAARRTNWLKAIEALRTLPGMSRRFLVYEEALIHCERPPLTGLLEDLHRLAGGMPAAPSAVLPDAKPYLPYVVPEPAVRTLPPERIAVNRASPAASPGRSSSPFSPGRSAAWEPPLAARSRRSTASPPPSPRVHPSRPGQGPAADSATAAGAAAAAAALPPHQQHPLFQKAVPVASPVASKQASQALLDPSGPAADGLAALASDAGAASSGGRGSGRGDSPAPRNNHRSRGAVSAAASGVRRAATVATDGSGGSGGRTLITELMVTPTKVFPPAGRREPQRPRPSSAAAAIDLLRASYPVAAWGHESENAGGTMHPTAAAANHHQNLHGPQGRHHHHHQQQQHGRNVSALRGSRSMGGAPEMSSASPALSPRLRLVPPFAAGL